ncbi:MAG: hypothetical protein LBL00_06835 [Endomicrobium sp.]|jgi:hypothetical protein|nr:hypothetical protein [Endomicrobium sp.]
MKKFIVLSFSAVMLFVASNVYAQIADPGVVQQTAMMTLWESVRNSQAGQTILQLKNSYDQMKKTYDDNKQYYDYVKELNEYKGGIGHLVRDKIMDEVKNSIDYIKRLGQERLDEITSDIESFSKVSISSYPMVADKLQKTIENRLKDESAVSAIVLKVTEEVGEALDKLTSLADKTGPESMNEFNRRAQIEVIKTMNKAVEALNTQRVNASVQRVAELKIEGTKSAKIIESLLNYKRAKDKDANYRSEEYFGGEAPVFIFGATKEDEQKAKDEKKAKTGAQ